MTSVDGDPTLLERIGWQDPIHGIYIQLPTTFIYLFNKVAAENSITSELAKLFQSLQKCLNLRDKYIINSRQRLGDNPKDYDGHFAGLADGIADVSTLRPDSDPRLNQTLSLPFEPWNIYPPPPPPQWHRTDAEKVIPIDGNNPYRAQNEFVFEDCHIPGPHIWGFAIDEKGVFQVYEHAEGNFLLPDKIKCLLNHAVAKDKKPLFDVPSIEEYFTDLDFVLKTVSNGPTQSFAVRRLKYLSSSFTMYILLNEFQELADMKVSLRALR
jgi:AMP deaminase